MKIMKRLVQEEEGQGLVEYALIIALISIAAILVMPTLGAKISDIFSKINTKLVVPA
ncbi:flp/fap pilin component [Trichococcus palustris]|uniref:Flp/fap pilin component n=1 Tax=Trichococcus palustris TaxID=140314 RepID=A0A143Y3L3_9LACT|nr:Flp family type IVb pilin [Trichococcus palustris]CZQ80835.1 flp/fap pilin component [Trichococcus palustris]SFK63784.1 pilus assembly protein Flp/PilA [Trichococcus palustris]